MTKHGAVDADFQHCRWSPGRPMRAKWTRIKTNLKTLTAMSGPCTLSHEHLPWGRKPGGGFFTAGEAEYPLEMAEIMASHIAEELMRRGFAMTLQLWDHTIDCAQAHKKRRATGGKQPRGKRLPPVVSEYQEIISMTLAQAKLTKSKVLRIDNGAPRQISDTGTGDSAPQVITNDLDDNIRVIAGVFRTPEQFVEEASKALRPSDLSGAVPDEIITALVKTLTAPPLQTIRNQLLSLRSLAKRVQDNKQEDERIFEAMDADARILMRGKSIKTLQDLIDQYHWPDKDLARDVQAGFRIVGMQPYAGVFRHEVKLPSTTVPELRATTEVSNRAVLARVASAGSDAVDQALWNLTIKEVESHWLKGPFETLQELENSCGPGQHLSMRFPLVRPGPDKIRAIDACPHTELAKGDGALQ